MQGQRVNNFRIVRLLGEGSMGAVYEAEHMLIHRQVAVKVLKQGNSVGTEAVQRLLNEARATSAIRHPNIVEIVDVGLLPDGAPYLVMELLEGESLGARLDRLGQLSLEDALDLVHQAADALDAAHRYGIVHRDLKPDNLFLARDPRAPERELLKVLDFGVAKLRPDLAAVPVQTMAGALFGTPTYMAPEQCRGLSDTLDQRADIYALGVILYEAVCGQPPFSAETVTDMILQHMHAVPPPPTQHNRALPADVEGVILKALAKEPNERFASMAEFSAALGRPLSRRSLLPRDSAPPPLVEARGAAGEQDVEPHASRAPLALARTAAPLPSPLLPAEERRQERAANAEAPAQRGRTRGLRRALWIALAAALLIGGYTLTRLQTGDSDMVMHSHEQSAAAETSVPPAARIGSVAAPPSASPGERKASASSAPLALPTQAAQAKAPRSPGSSHRHHASAPAAEMQTERALPRAQNIALNANRADPVPGAQPESSTEAAPPGYLSLDSEPWSEVFLGATLLGSTPLMHIRLPPGKHMLTLKNSEIGRSTSYEVEIKSGASVSRLVGWAQ